MRAMKIPNLAVAALLLVFAVLGIFLLPFETYLWQWSHFGVVLVITFCLNMIGAIGAGDAKFAAAAAPFIALTDLRLVVVLFAACLLAGYVAHRLAKHSPLRRLVPHWESWKAGKRFPMGLPLASALGFYLILVMMGGTSPLTL